MSTKDNNVIGLVLIVLVLIILGKYGVVTTQAIYPPTVETQLKTEYITEWADSTNGFPDTSICRDVNTYSCAGCQSYNTANRQADYNHFWEDIDAGILPKPALPFCVYADGAPYYYEGDTFIIQTDRGGFSYSNNLDTLVLNPPGVGSLYFRFKHNFKGQNFVLLFAGKGVRIQETFSTIDGEDTPTLLEFRPYTFEPTRYDVYREGFKIATTSITDNLRLDAYRDLGGNSNNRIVIYYVGYKAQFECDLSPNEVWIQEAFTSNFNINDLTFEPTKFCKVTRPFVLRGDSGETAIYPDPIPDFNKGLTQAVPLNSVVVANYATYNVENITNPCAPNEANVKVGNNWVCQSVIDTFVPLPLQGQRNIFDVIASIFTNFFNFIKSLFGF